MTEVKRHVEIAGYGVCLPKQTVQFKNQTRYRVVEDEETQLDLAEVAIQRALENANLKIEDIDCLVSASAVGVQPIPCTAALIHERVAKGLAIPAMDINTTCTSFISALSTMSYLIEAGEYHRVLIVSSEVGSLGLNPKKKKVLNSLVTEQQPLFSKQVLKTKGLLQVYNIPGQKVLMILKSVEV